MNIAEHIGRGARDYPERAALLFEGLPVTYGECDEMSSKAAGVFASAGVKAGDRVALFLGNSPEFVIAYLGALKLGAIAVSMNATLKRDEAALLIADCQPKVIVTTPDLQTRLPFLAALRVYTIGSNFGTALRAAEAITAARSMEPDDPAAIVYTSGTTGRPKGATLSHANVVRNIEAKVRYLGIRPEDRTLLFLPLYHCFGQNAILNASLHAGATVVLHPRFDFDHVMTSIMRDAVTMFFGVPTTYILLCERVSPNQMAGVRYYFSAAAKLPLEIEGKWAREIGLPIFQGYGLSETSPFASYNHLDRYRLGSIGTPIDGVKMKVVDPDTQEDVAPGEKGEILVRGHNVMLGYWGQREDTAKCLRDGWFHTGDIGSVDNEGYFFIEDRLTDIINVAGVNVYPAEIENVLAAHPAIAEAAIYGTPEPLLGEQVCAEIVLRPDSWVTEADIRSFCCEHLAPVKVPNLVNFAEAIPKGSTGKPLKRILRDRAAVKERERGKLRNVDRQEVERWIHSWLRQNLDFSDAIDSGSRTAFADLGMDSILSVRMAKELGDWSGRKIEDSAAWSFPSVEAMATHIVSGNGAGFQAHGSDIAALSDEAAETLLLTELEKLNR
jgi:long-chain acyl-CoA synthetase